MTERKKNRVTLCLLAALLAGFGLWGLVRPGQDISDVERRKLAQRPELTADALLTGTFQRQTEKWAADQFPLRQSFRRIKAAVNTYVLGQWDTNGVYLAEGYAERLDYPIRAESLAHAAGRMQYLYERYLQESGGQLYLAVIPDKNAFLAAENGYPTMDYAALTEQLRQQTPFLQYIDLSGQLTKEDYYRTDLHWRQERLEGVARYLAGAMGTQLMGTYRQVTLPRPFYGVYYGYAALPMEPDALTYLTGDALEKYRVYNYETDSWGGVYDLEKAEGRDMYEVFLSGSVSLLRIENPEAETERELVIFRDSFASSLAPLLAEGYRAVTLIDIRYIPSAYLGSYVDFSGKDVLFLYSTGVLNHSETLK